MTYFNRKLMKRDIPASATVGGFNDEDTDMYRIKTEEYLKRRVIFSKKYKIEPEASIVRTSSPEKTIRIVNALKELKN